VEKLSDGYYEVLHPLRPNPQIASVVVVAFPSTGVCQIIAESQRFANDSNAAKAKQAEDDLAAALTVKYGPPASKLDECDDSGGGCDSSLAMKMNQQAAHYGYGWNFESAPRADHIGIIGALVRAHDAVTTSAGVGFLSDRTAACQQAIARAAASGL
jgi:hypothetical protein